MIAAAPKELADRLRFASIDPERPLPLVVEGSDREWSQAAAAPELPGLLAAHPAATIAVVEGEPGGLAALFDLAGPADAAAVWVAALERWPQAGTVLARVLRLEPASLLAESLGYSALQAGPEHAAWLGTLGPRRPPEPGQRVRVEQAGATTVITLTRFGRHNALDARMREELCDALDAAAERPGPVELRGEGPSFCSGGDLDEFGTLVDPVHAHFVRSGRSAAQRLLRLRGRVTARVHGWCVGAGVELSAFATHLVAAEDTRFRLPETSFGLLPGSGGCVSLPPRIGRRRTLEMALTGRVVEAATALEWGLVDEVVAG